MSLVLAAGPGEAGAVSPRALRPVPALLSAVLVALAALSPARAAETPKRGGTFRVPMVDATGLDPHLGASFTTQTFVSLAYGQLVRFPAGPEQRSSSDNRILPDLAERWEWASPTTVVFTLRKEARFHRKPPVNGREVTAEDVKYSLDRFRARSPQRVNLEPVQSVDVLDRHRVRIVLREPYAPLLNILATPSHCAILPREVEQQLGDFNRPEAVIGTGPFVLRSYERGVRAVFERNPDYLMPGLPYLDGVSIEIVPDPATRLALLRAHKLELAHWWGWITPEEGRGVKQTNPEMVITSQMVLDVASIWMRTDQPPFSDVRARRAVALAIDRKGWREALHYGEGCLDSGPVPCAMTEWKLDASTLEPARRKYLDGYDLAEARRLLAEAGVARGLSVPIQHSTAYAPPWRNYYDLAAESLGALGLAPQLRAEDQGKYGATTSVGKIERMAMGPYGAGTTEVDGFLFDLFHSQGGVNRSRVNDPELDRMLVAQRREMDPARRRELVLQIQRYLADKAYYVYLPMWPRYIAHPPYVKGFRHHDGFGLAGRLMYTWLDR